jgi:hypothetical protein
MATSPPRGAAGTVDDRAVANDEVVHGRTLQIGRATEEHENATEDSRGEARERSEQESPVGFLRRERGVRPSLRIKAAEIPSDENCS